MPEYAQIQTYATYDQENFYSLLECYRNVLQHLGCTDEAVLTWLTQLPLPVGDEDFGDIYAAPFILAPTKTTEIVCSAMNVGLYPRIGAPTVEEQRPWIAFNLLFDATSLQKQHVYKREVGPVLWQIMQELVGSFQEVGVYFTDEWQDNQAWRVIAEGVGDPWVFEMGIFPRKLAERFKAVPPGFQGTVIESGFGFALENRWERLPWLEQS